MLLFIHTIVFTCFSPSQPYLAWEADYVRQQRRAGNTRQRPVKAALQSRGETALRDQTVAKCSGLKLKVAETVLRAGNKLYIRTSPP